MTRAGTFLGYAGALLILASAAMHSVMGWPAMSAEIAKLHPSADLMDGLALAWHFGAVCMLGIGVSIVHLLRTGQSARFVMAAFGLLYTAFGVAEIIHTEAGFAAVFVVPGVLLVASSYLLRR
jgi:hypothetical protein